MIGRRVRPGKPAIPVPAETTKAEEERGQSVLSGLFTGAPGPVLSPRLHQTSRDPPGPGQWSRWEAIWRKTTPAQTGAVPRS